MRIYRLVQFELIALVIALGTWLIICFESELRDALFGAVCAAGVFVAGTIIALIEAR